jgi:4-diphosphocytidyl-2-C-methyl-D-erythritol kinase
MVPISLYDEIQIEAESREQRMERGQSEIMVRCDDPTIPGDETNLAYKAAVLLCREAKVQATIAISLHKRIPAGAGLGGGSSDAAAVLKGLNGLLALELTEERLCQIGTWLGADVPFFISCRPARVEGIGERVTPLPPLPTRWLVLVVPPFAVSTPWAYARFDELPIVDSFSAQRAELAPGLWPSSWLNDLERAVLPTHPQLGVIKEELLRLGAEGAMMSGSGSSVFGVFQDSRRAEQAVVALRDWGEIFLAEPLAGPPPVDET